ncbi:MAG: DUF4861 domain-containing protein [Bacteroidota bacterium]
MNTKIIFISLFMVFGIMASAQQTVVLSNKLNIHRNDELVVLKRNQLTTLLKGNKQQLLQVKCGDSVINEIQYIDNDGDGVWDDALLLHSFKPKEKLTLTIELNTNKKIPSFTTIRAHVRQRHKNVNDTFGANLKRDSIEMGRPNTDFSKVKLPFFLTEGPAWENDKVGFRLYFDVRNGKDIWGKTTTAMMMDTVGANPNLSYHQKADWGMDILKVGSSLSAGALAIRVKLTANKDTLIRLGGKNMGRVVYEKIADGPLFAKFKLSYPEWKFANGYKPISLTEEISIWGGQYFYQSDVKIINAPDGTQLVTGFANHYALAMEQIAGQNASAFYSFGVQSENKDKLGLAVLALKQAVIGAEKATGVNSDVKDSYLVSLKVPKDKQAVSFRLLAAWEPTDPRFSDSTFFRQFLIAQTELLGSPIAISYL